jgi:predicted nuclease of restriction endonuclease-like (RecB) superfamily
MYISINVLFNKANNPNMKNIIKSEEKLLLDAIQIINKSKENMVKSIYNEATITYFKLGELIVTDEQSGKYKAEYGKKILSNLSKKLIAYYGKGYSVTTLKDARTFFLVYQKSRTVSDQFKLNFSHYSILMRLTENERIFYEMLAINENYGVRELKRAIDSNTIYRVLKEGKKMSNLGIKKYPETPEEVIKNPYVAEFLGIDVIKEGGESKIELALVNNLEKFLLELGKGFSFVGRQYKLHLSGDVFKTDLVFYNIRLKRYVIFEIKARKAQHKDIGQLQMYVNYFDREICDETDNPTIGILLCKDQNKSVIDFTLPKDNQTIFTSELKLYLPSREELGKFLDN